LRVRTRSVIVAEADVRPCRTITGMLTPKVAFSRTETPLLAPSACLGAPSGGFCGIALN